MEIGRICVKLSGRDAGKKCIIIENLDRNYVLIDGETRRRKCNLSHLEPTKDIVTIDSGIGHEDVKTIFSDMGITIVDKKSKPKTVRPVKQRLKNKKTETKTVKKKTK